MRFAVLLFILLASVASGDESKPATLTPKQIAEGWLMLFDGESTFG